LGGQSPGAGADHEQSQSLPATGGFALRRSRVSVAFALASVAILYPAQAALATKPHIRGPIVSYKCPPVPLWCTKNLRPGVTLTHLRAKMRSGPMQGIYKLSWRLGDPHISLLAEALNPPTAKGAIPIGTISHWAAAKRPPGLLGALNADFFGTDASSWSLGDPSGMLVHAGKVIDFGSGGPGVGYEAGGEMIMGTPSAKPAKITLAEGRTATIAAFNPGSSLSGIMGDQVAIKTTLTAPVKVPTGWVGFVVGDSTTPSPFTTMLRGSEQLPNPTGNNTSETVRGFRFGDGDGVVTTVALPVSNAMCRTYVCAGGTSVQLQPGQALMIANNTHDFAAQDLISLAQGKQHSHHTIKVSVDAAPWAQVQDVMGGKPQLVTNGAVTYPKIGFNPPMMSSDGWQWMYPHWRPALAETRTHGWMIITGGINYSDGVYGWDWGKMLVQLGAVNAMGFDNNSSTELYVPSTGTWTFSPHWQREITEATALTYH
jgi:Phosphodiester glycosidase